MARERGPTIGAEEWKIRLRVEAWRPPKEAISDTGAGPAEEFAEGCVCAGASQPIGFELHFDLLQTDEMTSGWIGPIDRSIMSGSATPVVVRPGVDPTQRARGISPSSR